MSTPTTEPEIVYRHAGYCTICEADVEFTAKTHSYRDHLVCSGCKSVPRERAMALTMMRHVPNWRELTIHESSPSYRGISPKMRRECSNYLATQFYPGEEPGKLVRNFRNENLEAQTFADESFDLVVSLDVMEHVNMPDVVMREVCRTLKPGGYYLFTVPTFGHRGESERRALYKPDGTIEHFAKPEYHGNPVDQSGALVTFHYGYDLAELLCKWSGMDVEVNRFHDHRHGLIGRLTEVYITRKPG